MDKPLEQACGNTMSQKVEKTVEEQSEIMIAQHIFQMKKHGGGLTLDFAKKTSGLFGCNSSFCERQLEIGGYGLAIHPVSFMHKKTSENVRLLVVEELEKLGIGSVNLKKLFNTTDEGSNLAKLGGSMHQICMSHLGSTIAKRSTKPYKNSCLSEEEKNACLEVSSGLCCLEKLVSNVRQIDQVRKIAGKALVCPVETRWLSQYYMVVYAYRRRYGCP